MLFALPQNLSSETNVKATETGKEPVRVSRRRSAFRTAVALLILLPQIYACAGIGQGAKATAGALGNAGLEIGAVPFVAVKEIVKKIFVDPRTVYQDPNGKILRYDAEDGTPKVTSYQDKNAPENPGGAAASFPGLPQPSISGGTVSSGGRGGFSGSVGATISSQPVFQSAPEWN